MPWATALESLLDASPRGVFLLDADGTVAFADEAAAAALDEDERTLVGRDWYRTAVPEPHRTNAREAFEAVLEADEPTSTSVPVRSADDRPAATVSLEAVPDAEFVVGRFDAPPADQAGAWFDPYRRLVESFPNGIVTLFDEDHRFRVVGGTGFAELSRSPEEIEGKQLGEAFPDENAAVLEPLFDAALDGEENAVTLTPEDRIFEVRVLPLRTATGDVAAGMTVSQDATGRVERQSELREAREHYRALIENAPVPVFVADGDGELVEMNERAEALVGRRRADVLGEHYLTLAPGGEEDRYRALFEDRVENGGTRRYTLDGEQMAVVTGDGQRVPVESSVSVVERDGETLIHAIVKDISEHVWYETALEELHENAGDLVLAEDEAEVAQSIVDTVVDTLDRPFVSVNLFDAEAELLRPVAYSAAVTDLVDGSEPPALELHDCVAGEAYLSGETQSVDDVRLAGAAPDAPLRGAVVVPIDEFGVLVCGHADETPLEREERRLLEVLARNAETVLDRVRREQELRRQERELTEQTERLRQVEELNGHIRALIQLATRAETAAELAAETCSLFSSTESFAFAWYGELTPEGDALVPSASAGDDQGYLGTQSLRVADDAAQPAVRAAGTGEPTVVSNVADGVHGQSWQRKAVRRGFRSVFAIPVTYQGVLYGVLAVYADEQDAFPTPVRDVLCEWGELMGYAMNEIQQTNALLSHEGTVLRWTVRSKDCPLLRVAHDLRCSFRFEGLHRRDDESATAFLTIAADYPGETVALVEDAPGIASVEHLRDTGDGALYQVEFAEAFIATVLAKYGLRLDRIVGRDDGDAYVRVCVPSTMPVHRAVDVVTTEYPDAELVATEPRPDEPAGGQRVEDAFARLTDRQREALEIAYHGGYFESPKAMSGGEIAERMGISASSFHSHLRAAERKLLDALLANSRLSG
ncbi:PAS domain S-box protein [Halobacterium yunchengense]|uniref:PAS domain S-box protein n=1 Tax=Halobacterium yunchengense TaxID=3108497 RepID=UPI00300A277A